MQVKVLSWNIWIHSYFNKITDFLDKTDADIIGLQEVDSKDAKRDVIEYFQKKGYEFVFSSAEKVWKNKIYSDGPAIFTKLKVLKKEKYFIGGKDKRAIVKVSVEIGGKVVNFYSTHLTHTHQQEWDSQKTQIDDLIKLVSKEKTIIAGDFNAIQKMYAIKTMTKYFQDANKNELPTWSNYIRGCMKCRPTKVDTTLDYLFASRDIKVKKFEVLNPKGSDHLPILADLEI